jgi:hypothetical protein
MSNARLVGGLCVLFASVLGACGDSYSPAQPAPVASAAPTPAPTPPPKPLSVIPTCPLPAYTPAKDIPCDPRKPVFGDDVGAAIDRVIAQRPELFDFNNVNGGPAVRDVDAYMVAVVASLGQAGTCGLVGPEGEIAVKIANSWSEQWIVVSRVGWGTPTPHWVSRKYKCTSYPAGF